MLVTDVEDEIWWGQLWDVDDRFITLKKSPTYMFNLCPIAYGQMGHSILELPYNL